jgi:ABC-type uncharacterized transport system auxiliary subunit
VIAMGGKMTLLLGKGVRTLPKNVLFFTGLILFLSLFTPTGCLNLQEPARYVEQYTLEYPSPEVSGLSSIETSLKVERFTEAPAYNTSAMIYRPEPFKLDAYQYHRWRVHPADLVTDYLLRDFRKSGLFKAIFSHLDQQGGRFILEGGVEEFLETDAGNNRQALLTLNVTLLDSSFKDIPRRILFQKRYRFQEPIAENTPRGLAKGMSQAMRRFSEELIQDVYSAARGRVQ